MYCLPAPNRSSKIRVSWNKGKIVGQKRPFTQKEIWAIRARLEFYHQIRDLALLNLGLDSKLRSSDLLKLRITDISHGNEILSRAMVIQQKTKRPVQFEITEPVRKSVKDWIDLAGLSFQDYLFPSKRKPYGHLCWKQHDRLVKDWAISIGLDPTNYGTHSIRRTKATIFYERTKNLRATQLLLGHSRIDSTSLYLGIEVNDALELSENLII